MKLTVSEALADAINFVGVRYAWADESPVREPGEHEVPEWMMCEWRDAVDDDDDGGLFQLLVGDAFTELLSIYDSIV